jgi:hypothetical protein
MNSIPLRPIVRHLARLVPTAVVLGGFFAVTAAPIPLQTQRSQENYELCASQLLMHDLDEETIALACATAFEPTDLAACVSEIDNATEISAADAIDACREVRRPLELSNCTVRIDAAFMPDEPLKVLDSCRRSLLPVEFANCTVGINNHIVMDVDTAMATCLDASDRVRDAFPTFIPTR